MDSLPNGNIFSAVVAGETTRRTTFAVYSERKRRRLLQLDARAWPKECRHRPNSCSESSAVLSLCQADGPGRGVKSRCPKGLVVKAIITQNTKKFPNPSPQPVTVVPKRPKMIATKKTARPEIPETKATAAPKESTGKPKERKPRMSKRWLQIHNNQRGCPHSNFNLHIRGNLCSLRPPSTPSICGADPSPPHVHLPTHRVN